jgi:hypothetical protein
MQYTQRRLHLSVTDIRKYVIGRLNPSTSEIVGEALGACRVMAIFGFVAELCLKTRRDEGAKP